MNIFYPCKTINAALRRSSHFVNIHCRIPGKSLVFFAVEGGSEYLTLALGSFIEPAISL